MWWGLNELIHARYLEQCLASGRLSFTTPSTTTTYYYYLTWVEGKNHAILKANLLILVPASLLAFWPFATSPFGCVSRKDTPRDLSFPYVIPESEWDLEGWEALLINYSSYRSDAYTQRRAELDIQRWRSFSPGVFVEISPRDLFLPSEVRVPVKSADIFILLIHYRIIPSSDTQWLRSPNPVS